MLSVANKPFRLIFIMLNVVMLNVAMQCDPVSFIMSVAYMLIVIMLHVVIQSAIYSQCHKLSLWLMSLCSVSFMLSVTNKPFRLIVIMLNVIMLSVIFINPLFWLSLCWMSLYWVSFMLNDVQRPFILIVIKPSKCHLGCVTNKPFRLIVTMLNVVMQSVI